jgi:hypothetical protein
VCVLVTRRYRGHVAEVELGAAEGLDHDSTANCDNVFTLPVAVLTRRRGGLGPAKLADLETALMISLGLARLIERSPASEPMSQPGHGWPHTPAGRSSRGDATESPPQ